jgi:NitT/TauT family transport system substrate-binding protein
MVKKLRYLSSCLAGAAFALVLPGATLSAQEMAKVRLAQNLSPISGVVIVAKTRGFFERQKLDVTVSNFTSGRQALETMLGGGADLATTAEAPITAAAMANQKIAFLARIVHSDLKTITATDSGIAKLADLRGKRIGFSSGTGSEVYTAELLKRAGLTPGDVKLVSLRPQDMAAAMSANGIDAMNTWEPHVANAKKALGARATELDTKGIYAETFNVVTSQDFLAAKQDVVVRFVRAMVEAHTWMKANAEEAIADVATTVGMPRQDLAAIWADYSYDVAIDARTTDVLKAHAGWRLETGNAPSGATMPDFTKLIFPAPLRAVAPERVSLQQQ